MLTDSQIKALIPRDTRYSIADGEGLTIDVMPSGRKSWMLSYRIAGKQHRKKLGDYPDIKAKQAREMARDLKARVASSVRKISLQDVVAEWLTLMGTTWTNAKHADVVARRLEKVTVRFADIPVSEVSRMQISDAIKRIVAEGKYETARRSLQPLSSVFDYAVTSGYCQGNPCTGMGMLIPVSAVEHHACLQIQDMPQFWADIRQTETAWNVGIALRLICLTAVRVNELLRARWDTGELDLESGVWSIPAGRMKMREPHVVPLSPAAVELFAALKKDRVTGYLFPNRNRAGEHMRLETLLALIKRTGYNGRMTTHGFRTLFSTAANASGMWRHDVIERQLAHKEKNVVRDAYNRADYLEERRELMNWWSGVCTTWFQQGN